MAVQAGHWTAVSAGGVAGDSLGHGGAAPSGCGVPPAHPGVGLFLANMTTHVLDLQVWLEDAPPSASQAS